jgi:hypothetical protein
MEKLITIPIAIWTLALVVAFKMLSQVVFFTPESYTKSPTNTDCLALAETRTVFSALRKL